MNGCHRYGIESKELVYFQRFFKNYLNGMTTSDMCHNYINEYKDKAHQNIAENDIDFFEKVYLELAGN